MKKLFVLLIAAAVAMGASAGVNNKIVTDAKVKKSEVKAKALDRQVVKKGDVNVLPGTPLKAWDATARPTTNHAQKRGETLFWDFEDEAQMNDWVVLDEDGDGYCWEYLYDSDGVGFKTHSGLGLVFSASYDNPTYTALTPDNWLVSPWIELGGTFGFYACGQDPSYASEVFGIYLYVNMEWIQLAEYTATGVMKAYWVDLSEYEGNEGCLAIVHHNVTDMFRLNVDDITIGEFVPEEEPEAPTVITEIPEGCATYTYYRNSSIIYSGWYGISGGTTDGKFTVAFDMTNGDVYVQNPAWYYDNNNSWVKGTYDWMTGIITIPTGQYLTWSDSYQYGIRLGWGSTYVYEDYDDEGELGYYLGTELDERTTEIQMMIDGDYIYLLGTEGDLNAEFPENFNATGMYTYWSDDLAWTTLEFCNRDEYGYAQPFGYIVNLVPAVPANPTADDWYDCGDESGFSKFYFTLPTQDVDGNMLDPEYLSYVVWINDGFGNVYQFTFPAEDYTFDLYEDIDEVPYELYSNAVDFHDYYCYMYRTNENDNPLFVRDADHKGNIGIQVFYTVNGERNGSDIVWLYEDHVGVNELNAGKTVANVRYFNVAGQEMAQPEGMTIMVTTYTDGTSSAVKVVK